MCARHACSVRTATARWPARWSARTVAAAVTPRKRQAQVSHHGVQMPQAHGVKNLQETMADSVYKRRKCKKVTKGSGLDPLRRRAELNARCWLCDSLGAFLGEDFGMSLTTHLASRTFSGFGRHSLSSILLMGAIVLLPCMRSEPHVCSCGVPAVPQRARRLSLGQGAWQLDLCRSAKQLYGLPHPQTIFQTSCRSDK